MLRALAVLACLNVLAPRAVGQTDERAAQAKQHYETGMAHFQLEEWDKAIEEWEAGFRTKPVPQFLYNIAQAYRLSKRPEKALAFYQKYLRMDPKAPNKAEVDRHIAQLTRIVAENAKTASSPPTGTIEAETGKPRESTPPQPVEAPPPTVTPPPAPVVTPSPSPAPPPPSAAPAPVATHADVTATAPEKKPLTKKGWFWGVIAGVGAVVVAGVVVGVVLGTSGGGSTRTLPAVRF